jgi:hypothetical protein
MAEKLHPYALQAASVSQIDEYGSSQHIDTTLAQDIIDSSRVAMRELTRQSILTWPCHKILTLSLKKPLPTTRIQPIDVKTVKSVVNQAASKVLPLAGEEALLLCRSERSEGVKISIRGLLYGAGGMGIFRK